MAPPAAGEADASFSPLTDSPSRAPSRTDLEPLSFSVNRRLRCVCVGVCRRAEGTARGRHVFAFEIAFATFVSGLDRASRSRAAPARLADHHLHGVVLDDDAD